MLPLTESLFKRNSIFQEREKRGYKAGHTVRVPTLSSACPLGGQVIQELPSWKSVSVRVNVKRFVYQLLCALLCHPPRLYILKTFKLACFILLPVTVL